MGAYIVKGCSSFEMWKFAVKKRQKLIFSPQYGKAIYDECIMAITFGYISPLLEKILSLSLPSEYEGVLRLFNGKVDIKFSNGNLVISN
jgi:hypothetical protein